MAIKIISSSPDGSFLSINAKAEIHDIEENKNNTCSCDMIYDTDDSKSTSIDINNNLISTKNETYSDQELHLLNFYEKCQEIFQSDQSQISTALIYDSFDLFDSPRDSLSILPENFHIYDNYINYFLTYSKIQLKNLVTKNTLYDFYKQKNFLENIYNFFGSLKENDYDRFKLLTDLVDDKLTDPQDLSDYNKVIDDHPSAQQTNESSYEILGYRIDKYQYDNPNSIRTWIIPKSNNNSHINFFDTEIMYNKRYNYKISLLLVIVGEYNGELTPFLTLTESTSFLNKYLIKNKAPLKPQVSIIPYSGIDNKVLFLLSGRYGESKEIPIPIDNADIIKYDLIKQSQIESKIINENDEYINFFSNKQEKNFTMYRLDIEPKSYLDFASSNIVNINNSYFIDNIKSNKKYYYIFRARDDLNVHSNPTDIFCVELVNANGLIYPIIETFQINSNNTQTDIKRHFKEKIEIMPSIRNLIYNADDNLPLGERLGSGNYLCWGKNFKIRVTSISSGKKIDLNFKFTKKER